MTDFDVATALKSYIPPPRVLDTTISYWWEEGEDPNGKPTKIKVYGIKVKTNLLIGREGYFNPAVYSEMVIPEFFLVRELKDDTMITYIIEQFFAHIKEMETRSVIDKRTTRLEIIMDDFSVDLKYIYADLDKIKKNMQYLMKAV